MADKLSKRQRIYAREQLHNRQHGKCADCENGITILKPGVRLSEDWRRAILKERDDQYRLICQRCDTDAGWRDVYAAERAAVDRILKITA